MAKGTDIYIVSGEKKGGIVLTLLNGKSFLIPEQLLYTVSNEYATGSPKISGFVITADSVPAYDTWGWADYWECGDWMYWHQLNAAKYGVAEANRKFVSYWGQQDALMAPYNWCKYKDDFANYFAAQGIDVGWLLSHLIVSTKEVGDDGIEVVKDVAEGVKNTGSLIGFALPVLALGAGAYAFKEYIYPMFKK